MKFWTGTAFMNTAEMPSVAKMLDENGYHGVLVSDHLIFPRELKTRYPATESGVPYWQPDTEWPDAWVLIGAMAAVTENLHFGNNVYIAPARPILEVAKQVGTAGALSNGRVSIGLSAGWMREEFELLGQDFDNRGPRLNEMIQALRALWKGGWVSWKGEYYDIPEMMIEPHPPAPVPILCGGESAAALKRAARYCDGWVGTAYTLEEATVWIDRIKGYRREYGRENEPFEIILGLFDERTPDLYKRAEDIGITGVMCSPWANWDLQHSGDHSHLKGSAEQYRAPIEKFAEEIVSKCL
ncbi:TIGR03619 family F420-dependent LLM class oxidoreductase [Rhodococcus sp. WS3]|jgi:probable F420-dependent oxidoreductase|uniref:TIGR03619 family F420-dependent LLM class oxidoreductase n=1 Tax=Rhodococcus sp. WS3 TaxID=2486271 RepID=UPI000E269851|nr:TIGR03619 family F420-dependent LLM class oxidoreductase [Rhodococcus sp. WS3]ROZ50041.1 TIGR03619 family F420-dependent LLM class oxidoreductase [Rhodococcus sp. WS3]